jgi:hypothetical protein
MKSDPNGNTTLRINVLSASIGAVIAAILAFGGTWLYGIITDKQPQLTYRLTEGPPMPGSLTNSTVYAIEVSNRGKREASDVRLDLRFGDGELREKSLNTPQGMQYKEQVSPDKKTYLFTSPLFNPGDRVTGSVTVQGSAGAGSQG